jgi:hypothetical protein
MGGKFHVFRKILTLETRWKKADLNFTTLSSMGNRNSDKDAALAIPIIEIPFSQSISWRLPLDKSLLFAK